MLAAKYPAIGSVTTFKKELPDELSVIVSGSARKYTQARIQAIPISAFLSLLIKPNLPPFITDKSVLYHIIAIMWCAPVNLELEFFSLRLQVYVFYFKSLKHSAVALKLA